MLIQEKKKNTEFLTGNYAKQERASMISDICSLHIAGEKERPVLKVKKVINNVLHVFSAAERPSHKDMLYLQSILSIAGNRLAEFGDEVLVKNAFADDDAESAFNEIAEDFPAIKKPLGYGYQVEFTTTYHEILMKAGLSDGLNSRNALKRALFRLGNIVHQIHVPDLYENKEYDKGHNELFLKYSQNSKTGKIKISINSMFTNALTNQFTLIDLDVKKYFIRNERALGLYDYIVSRVNRGEDQHFNLDRVIKIIENNTDDVDKYTRKKYKSILDQLEKLVDWKISSYGSGPKQVFLIDWTKK